MVVALREKMLPPTPAFVCREKKKDLKKKRIKPAMPRPYSVVFSDFTNIQGTVTWNLPQYLSGLSLAMLHFFHNNYLSQRLAIFCF